MVVAVACATYVHRVCATTWYDPFVSSVGSAHTFSLLFSFAELYWMNAAAAHQNSKTK